METSTQPELTKEKLKLYNKSILKSLSSRLKKTPTNIQIDTYLNEFQLKYKPLGKPHETISKPIILKSGSAYIGEVLNNATNGLGYLLDADLNYYEGYFVDTKQSGEGRLFTPKGEMISGLWENGEIKNGKIIFPAKKKYKGEIKDLEPHGEGKEKTENYVYRGQFFHSKKHGKGSVTWNDGTSYSGELRNGKIEGFGVYKWADSTYEGQWRANKMDGNGVQIWTNGSKYEGSMTNGLKDGFGTFISDEKKYTGFWKGGKEDGKGRLEKNGTVLEGMWANGQFVSNDPNIVFDSLLLANRVKNTVSFDEIAIPEKVQKKYSKILEIWKNISDFDWDGNKHIEICNDNWHTIRKGMYFGETDSAEKPSGKGIWIGKSEIYEGNWLNSFRLGFGREVNIYNEIYYGEWLNGYKCGFGTLKKNKSKYIGDWNNNKFNGKGLLVTKDAEYEGDWVNGIQQGEGKIIYSNGNIYTGEFKNGSASGIGKLVKPDGSCVEGFWENGNCIKKTKKIVNDEEESIGEQEEDELDEFIKNLKYLNHNIL